MTGSRRLAVSKWLEWIALGLIPLLTAIRVTPVAGNPGNVAEMAHRDIVHYYVVSIGLLSVLGVLGKAGQWQFGGESKIRLKAVVDALFEIYFEDVPDEQKYENRITLFAANGSRTRLRPYCRSGEHYQRAIPSFRIGDAEAENEGLVGQAWFRNSMVRVNDLPEVPLRWSDVDAACRNYAERGLLQPRKAGRLRVKSRSLLAMPVRNLQGRKWGVLILDSRSEDAFTPSKDPIVTAVVTMVGKMV